MGLLYFLLGWNKENVHKLSQHPPSLAFSLEIKIDFVAIQWNVRKEIFKEVFGPPPKKVETNLLKRK